MASDNQMLNNLKTKHREIARLSFGGLTPADIAKQTNIGMNTVYKILRDPICQAYIGGLGDKVDETVLSVRERLMNLNASTLDRFEEIMGKESKAPHSVIASVGKDVLDRTGYKAPDRIDINHTLQHKSDEEIDAQIEAAMENVKSAFDTDTSDILEEDAPDEPTTRINPKTDYKEQI
ncbi:MAG: sigma-70 family RNA polymerase sigma factor [bacterium]|nr:sigma-70 family RNA polymerase sigma factor [bacterium]